MHPRIRLTAMALGTLAIAAAAAFLLLSNPQASDSHDQVDNGFVGSIRPNAPPSNVTLRDEEGRDVSLAGYRGKPVIVTFMYTSCQNDCPIMAEQIRTALDDLGHDVPTVAVSVDPAHDTPAAARAFLTKHRLTGRMHFLLGNTAQLQRVWRAYGIQPQENGREHSASVVLLDRTGRQRVGFPVSELSPTGVAHDLRALESQ